MTVNKMAEISLSKQTIINSNGLGIKLMINKDDKHVNLSDLESLISEHTKSLTAKEIRELVSLFTILNQEQLTKKDLEKFCRIFFLGKFFGKTRAECTVFEVKTINTNDADQNEG